MGFARGHPVFLFNWIHTINSITIPPVCCLYELSGKQVSLQRMGAKMNNKLIEYTGYAVNGLSLLLYFALMPNLPTIPFLKWLAIPGLILFGIGLCLVVVSSITLARNRGTGLYTRGIYGLVRHPLYLGAMLLFGTFFFFCPHWIMFMISLVNIIFVYGSIQQGEQLNIQKFGDDYRYYMKTVPKINLLAGIFRLVQGKQR